MMLILHYYAYTSENTYEYINLFYYGELSNLFTYITYHFIKTKNDDMAYVSSLFSMYMVLYFQEFIV